MLVCCSQLGTTCGRGSSPLHCLQCWCFMKQDAISKEVASERMDMSATELFYTAGKRLQLREEILCYDSASSVRQSICHL